MVCQVVNQVSNQYPRVENQDLIPVDQPWRLVIQVAHQAVHQAVNQGQLLVFKPTNQAFVQVNQASNQDPRAKNQNPMPVDQGVYQDPDPGFGPFSLVIQVAHQVAHRAVNQGQLLVF